MVRSEAEVERLVRDNEKLVQFQWLRFVEAHLQADV
jgi:hypothetical protein